MYACVSVRAYVFAGSCIAFSQRNKHDKSNKRVRTRCLLARTYIGRRGSQPTAKRSAAYENQNINKTAENSWLTAQHVRSYFM